MISMSAGWAQAGHGDLLLYERQRYDGWYNNMANPEWGAVDSRLARTTPAHYEDGVYMMAETNRPSPRQLSEAFMKGSDGQGSVRNRTTMLAFFGQVRSSWASVPILSETVFKRHCHCRTAPHSIMRTPGGDLRDPDGERDAVMSDRGHQDPHIKVATARGLHVTCHVSRPCAGVTTTTTRSARGRARCHSTAPSTTPPRARAPTCPANRYQLMLTTKCHKNDVNLVPQKNKITAWIDGSFIYSTSEPWVSSMRTFVNGTLKMTGSGYPPHNTEGVPMHNFPAPHIQKPADPSRMYILGDPRSVTIRAVNEISRKFSQYLENIILSFNNIESKCLTNAGRMLN